MSRRGSPLNRAEIEQRRVLVAQLYLQKNTQAEIAKILNVDQSTISLDIKMCKKLWQAQSVTAIGEMLANANAELEEIKRKAIEGYHSEKNHHFLDTWLKSLAEQAKLFGLYAPTRQELSTNSNLPMQIEVFYAARPPKQLADDNDNEPEDADTQD